MKAWIDKPTDLFGKAATVWARRDARLRPMTDLLLAVGVLQLASAALMGWPIALQRIQPDLIKKAGVVAPRRMMQLHLDQVMMGLILLAIATAFPDLPDAIAWPLLIGTVFNPLFFVPLAFKPDLEQAIAFRIATVSSFIATSGSLTALAVWVLAGR